MSDEKTDKLAEATAVLSREVGGLADVVLVNNYKIDKFQNELNRKPDDEELKFLEEELDRRRWVHLRRAAVATFVSVILSSIVTFTFANHESKRRCTENNERTDTLIKLLNQFKTHSSRPTAISEAIVKLEQEKVDC